MQLTNRFFRFKNPGKLPVSFIYGGISHSGIGAEFSPSVEITRPDSRMIKYTITGRHETGLSVRMECVKYLDYPAWELLAFFENAGEKTYFSGKALTDGMEVAIPRRSGRIYFYRAID